MKHSLWASAVLAGERCAPCRCSIACLGRAHRAGGAPRRLAAHLRAPPSRSAQRILGVKYAFPPNRPISEELKDLVARMLVAGGRAGAGLSQAEGGSAGAAYCSRLQGLPCRTPEREGVKMCRWCQGACLRGGTCRPG